MSGRNNLAAFRKLLSKSKVIAVDSPIFIYHFEIIEPFFPLTSVLFDLFSEESVTLLTSVVSVAEVLTKPYIDRDEATASLIKATFARMKNLQILSIDQNLAVAAAFLRARYRFRLPDAFQIATAIVRQADIFVTNDKKLKKVKEVKIVCLSDFAEK
ncbi:PIN domain-containing protein [Candidatus Gottesmanbacteria bacterium]|nr:PIN domain-containing protein [Candidatus Gottesmanbacteria bacterium]